MTKSSSIIKLAATAFIVLTIASSPENASASHNGKPYEMWAKQYFSAREYYHRVYSRYFSQYHDRFPEQHQQSVHLVVAPTEVSSQQTTASVQFTLSNTGSTTINLQNSAPWRITNDQGQTVFSPISAQVITPLAPGESKTWRWDLRNNQGARVPSGYYRVVFDGLGVSTRFFVQ
ncbi:MAG: hypothetical protein WCT32_04740 [Patescibacteria group bacterium]|jgi:hypothetical protein